MSAVFYAEKTIPKGSRDCQGNFQLASSQNRAFLHWRNADVNQQQSFS